MGTSFRHTYIKTKYRRKILIGVSRKLVKESNMIKKKKLKDV